MFPWAATSPASGQSPPSINHHHSGSVAAVVDLAEQIPDDLIVLPGDEYAEFASGLSALRAAARRWQGGTDPHQFYLGGIAGFGNRHPLTLVRQALAQCLDEGVSSETTELPFIPDPSLRDSIRLDMSTAHRNLAEGEWKGATVLAGSATEALLLWALQEEEKQTAGCLAAGIATLVTAKVLAKPASNDPENWGLHQYVEVALNLDLIEGDTAKLVRLAKDFRNLIHPGRAARLGQTCDRGTALGALAAMESVARDLTDYPGASSGIKQKE